MKLEVVAWWRRRRYKRALRKYVYKVAKQAGTPKKYLL